jgi:hypothetical protein
MVVNECQLIYESLNLLRMQIRVSYSEILQFVRKKSGLDLSRVAIQSHVSDTVNISYQISKWLPAASISISVTSIINSTICFSYNCGPALSLIFANVISYLQANIPKGINVNTDTCQIILHLSEVNGLNQVVDDMFIDSLEFHNDEVIISAYIR